VRPAPFFDEEPAGSGSHDAAQSTQASAPHDPRTCAALYIKRSNITLRGAGPALTRLLKVQGNGSSVITMGQRFFKFVQPQDLTVDAAKGSSKVTVATDPGYKVGELVVVDQRTDPEVSLWSPTRSPPGDGSRGWFGELDRPIGQVVEIAAIEGTTLSFTTPLHLDFHTALAAHVVRFADGTTPVQPVRMVGIEDLYVAYGEAAMVEATSICSAPRTRG
jgi:hypothetical protein